MKIAAQRGFWPLRPTPIIRVLELGCWLAAALVGPAPPPPRGGQPRRSGPPGVGRPAVPGRAGLPAALHRPGPGQRPRHDRGLCRPSDQSAVLHAAPYRGPARGAYLRPPVGYAVDAGRQAGRRLPARLTEADIDRRRDRFYAVNRHRFEIGIAQLDGSGDDRPFEAETMRLEDAALELTHASHFATQSELANR